MPTAEYPVQRYQITKERNSPTLANMHNTYKLDDGHTEIDANILFYRLLVAQQQADIAHSFAYELTPYPAAAALFKDGFMRKPVKS